MTLSAKGDALEMEVETQPILEVHGVSSGSVGQRWSNAVHNWYHSAVVRVAVRNLALIALWYLLGTSLTLWNKRLVAKNHDGFFGRGPFPAPFLISALQFFAQHLIARAVIAAGLSQHTSGGDWWHYFKTVVPNGMATGLDIGFSNYSLVFVTISFYVMCKSTTPLFLLVFAIAWGIEKASWGLAGVVAVIATGLVLLVAGETKFNLAGFLLVMTAAMLAGLRWTITQVLLQGHKAHGAGSPTEVIFQLTPIMGLTVLLLSLLHERLWVTLPGSPYFDSAFSAFLSFLIVMGGGVLAFSMVWAEFKLIKCTSALTFMVAGTFKEIITVMAGVILDGDRFTWVNALGLAVLILGVVLFNLQKYRKLKRGELSAAQVDLEERHKSFTADEVVSLTNGGTPRGLFRRSSRSDDASSISSAGSAANGGVLQLQGGLSSPVHRSGAGAGAVFLIHEMEGEEGESLAMLQANSASLAAAAQQQQQHRWGGGGGGGGRESQPGSVTHPGTPKVEMQQRQEGSV